MLQGYKTFIAIIALVLNNLGFVEYSNQEVQQAINVMLAILAFLFRLMTTMRMRKLEKGGK